MWLGGFDPQKPPAGVTLASVGAGWVAESGKERGALWSPTPLAQTILGPEEVSQ